MCSCCNDLVSVVMLQSFTSMELYDPSGAGFVSFSLDSHFFNIGLCNLNLILISQKEGEKRSYSDQPILWFEFNDIVFFFVFLIF